MRTTTVALVALVAAFAAVASATSFDSEEMAHRQLFGKWRAEHGRVYHPTEVEYRFQVFRENAKFVAQHMQEYEQGLHTHTVELNHFADMTNQEFALQYKGYRAEGKSFGAGASATFAFEGEEASLPTSIDWRTRNVVGPVKNQGQCGSCWSFSTIASIEALSALTTGTYQSFSEQQLVDCVLGGADNCQVGGEMSQGFEYSMAHGNELESSYPYCACSGNTCAYQSGRVATHVVTSYQNITAGDEQGVIAAVAQRPTVSVAVNAAGLGWQLYGGGVFSSACPNSQDDLDHGVAIVGYTEDAVIVRNSWGAGWGEQGYIRLARGANTCGFADDASFPMGSSDESVPMLEQQEAAQVDNQDQFLTTGEVPVSAY